MRQMFSKKQIEEMINKGIESGEINLEDAPFKEFEITYDTNTRTINSSYSKCVVYHGILFFVFNALVSNETEASISSGTIVARALLDTETASKVYDFEGKPLTELNGTQGIMSIPFGRGQYGNSSSMAILQRSGNAKPLEISCDLSIESLSAGATHKISGRGFMLLVN